MDLAVLSLEENAGAVGLVDKGKAATIGAEPGVALDEVILPQPEVAGDEGNLLLRDFYVARPAAAVGTALAKVFGGLFQEMKIKMRLKMKVGAGT